MTTTVTSKISTTANANGTAPIPFFFQAISAEEIEVLRISTPMIFGVDYTVTLNGDSTGTINPIVSWGADPITVRSKPNFSQPALFERFAPLYPDQLNGPLDRLARTDLYLRTQITDMDVLVDANTAAIASLNQSLLAASLGIVVDASMIVRPESYGATGLGDFVTDRAAMNAAIGAAAITGGVVKLTDGATYIFSDLDVSDGVMIIGPRSATIKLPNQVSSTTTTALTSGTTAKTVTVTSAANFRVGMSVIIATGATVSPNDSFSHAGRQISAIVGNVITLAAGPFINAHAAGAIIASTGHLLRCKGNNVLDGFTVDGNEASNVYGHWITSALIVQEGDDCYFQRLKFQNTPSDAMLAGGPSGGEIKGSSTLFCSFNNIGGNGVHYGNIRDIFVIGNRMKFGNVRKSLPAEQAGGASIRLGHQDGAVVLSDNCANLLVAQNAVDDWICGVGALSTVNAANVNDNVTVIGNEFINCYRPLECILDTRRVVFSGNRCRATLPFFTGAQRFDSQTITVDGNSGVNRLRDVIITNNSIKNGTIYIDRARGFVVQDNIVDNSENSLAAYNAELIAATAIRMPIALYNYEQGIVRGNLFKGGQTGLWLQNSFALGTPYSRDTLIEGNIFANQFRWGLTGVQGSTGTFKGTTFRNNIVRQDNAATAEDGTALTFAADWFGLQTPPDLQIEGNRIEFNHGAGAAWSNSDNPTYMSRRENTVNGVYELFANFANDGAAAAGGVPVGAKYRNGSVLQQRVA